METRNACVKGPNDPILIECCSRDKSVFWHQFLNNGNYGDSALSDWSFCPIYPSDMVRLAMVDFYVNRNGSPAAP